MLCCVCVCEGHFSPRTECSSAAGDNVWNLRSRRAWETFTGSRHTTGPCSNWAENPVRLAAVAGRMAADWRGRRADEAAAGALSDATHPAQ